MRRFVVPIVFVLMATNAYAQECSQILQYGIWETQSREGTVVNTQQFANWACSAQSRSRQKGISLDVPGYGNFDEQAKNSFSSSDCSSASGNYELSATFRERMKSVAAPLVDAWSRCISALGSHASIGYGADPDSFTIHLRRVVDEGVARASARIKALPADGMRCTLSSDELGKGVEFEGSRTIACQRINSRESLNIEINFVPGGGRSIFVPAVEPPPPAPQRTTILIPVTRITRKTNVEVGGGLAKQYGADVLHNAPPYGKQPNGAEFDFDVDAGGKYRLEIEYAALQSRPVEISLNGTVIAGAGLALTTRSWTDQQWKEQSNVVLRPGKNTLRLYRDDVFPHIRTIRFTPVN